jgi:hypothetical protein
VARKVQGRTYLHRMDCPKGATNWTTIGVLPPESRCVLFVQNLAEVLASLGWLTMKDYGDSRVET